MAEEEEEESRPSVRCSTRGTKRLEGRDEGAETQDGGLKCGLPGPTGGPGPRVP